MTLTRARLVHPLGILLGFALFQIPDSYAASETERELRQICQELLDAVAPGRVEVWRQYLDERVIHVDENGTRHTKDELLKELAPLPRGLTGSMTIENFHVQLHGPVAVVAYEIQENLDYHGQSLHSRYRSSDTWSRSSQGWRLIAQQVSAVLKDPPAIRLPRSQLCSFDGTYELTPDITMDIRCSTDGLSMRRSGRPGVEYLPETADVFFARGQPRGRRLFERDVHGRVIAMLDRREGEDIRWIRKP